MTAMAAIEEEEKKRYEGKHKTRLPNAKAVLPVPGGPARRTARPAIRFVLIMSTMMPEASRASSCPTRPAAADMAKPLSSSPNPKLIAD